MLTHGDGAGMEVDAAGLESILLHAGQERSQVLTLHRPLTVIKEGARWHQKRCQLLVLETAPNKVPVVTINTMVPIGAISGVIWHLPL